MYMKAESIGMDKDTTFQVRYLVLHRNRRSSAYIQRQLQIGYSRTFEMVNLLKSESRNQAFKYRKFRSKRQRDMLFNKFLNR